MIDYQQNHKNQRGLIKMKKVYEVSKVLHEKTRYVSEVEATSEEEAIKIAQEQADWEAMDIDLIAEFEPTVERID